MRAWILGAFLFTACTHLPTTPTDAACARAHTREIIFSNVQQPGVATARSEGPNCGQAFVTLTLRGADGEPEWAMAASIRDMALRASQPGSAFTKEQMDAFLSEWTTPRVMRSGELPAWPEGAASLPEDGGAHPWFTEWPRNFYETVRLRNAPMLCFSTHWEAEQCLVMDPDSGRPVEFVVWGV